MAKKYENSSDLNAALTQAVARRKDQQSQVVDPKVRWKRDRAASKRKRSIIAAALLGPLALVSMVGSLWYSGLIRFGKPSQLGAALASPQSTLELNLGSMKLGEYPEDLKSLVALRKLNLDDNAIASLPASVNAIRTLEDLSMQYNELSSLPQELGQLGQLKSLNFKNNRLTSLPSSLVSLEGLQSLDVSNNQLAELPPTIGQLKSLKVFRLKGNKLTQLPPSFSKLHALQEIDLSGNPVAALPEAKSFPNLRVLNLRGTRVPATTVTAYQAISHKVKGIR